jgi:butyryl-CoA dehydrogenase
MNFFKLTEDQLAIQQMVREITHKSIRPIAAEIDEQERFPVESIRLLADTGILGLPYSSEYGGGDGDFLSFILAIEEISKACAATASVVCSHFGVAMTCMNIFGTEEQKRKYLPYITDGRILAFALTEAGAGSDAAGMQTKAVKKGDNYCITGTKMFISSAPVMEAVILVAVTGENEQGRKEYTAFLVDKNTPGISVGKHIHKMGIRAAQTAELVLEDVVVPASNILGEVAKGMQVALASLDTGRICMGTQAIGIAQGALDETYRYVSQREQFGKRLSQFQNTQFKLADLQTRADAGRLLLWRAAMLKDQGEPFSKEAAMGKLYCSDLAMETTVECVQLHGGYGYTKEYPVERMMRDAKITQIYEGTNEIQKLVIARALGVK